MAWIIMRIGPPAAYIKMNAKLNVTFQADEADKFASEYEATMKLLELKLPRDWLCVPEFSASQPKI